MRRLMVKWIVGCVALFLPLIIALIGRELDRSAYRHDATYRALIPAFVYGSLALAALVPAILLMKSRAPTWRRVCCVVVAWCLLLVELYWTFFSVVIAP